MIVKQEESVMVQDPPDNSSSVIKASGGMPGCTLSGYIEQRSPFSYDQFVELSFYE